jgi:hypothetical protein
MACVALNANNEPSLPPVLLYGGDAVAQRLKMRLQSAPGSWFLDPDAGLPLGDWMTGARNVPLPVAELALRRQLESDPAVVRVDSVTSARGTRDLALTALLTWREDGQQGTLRLTFDPYSGEAAVAWYISVGNIGGV